MVLMILMIVPFASARLLADEVHLSRIRFGDYDYISGRELDSYVFVYNDNPDERVRDGSVSIRFVDEEVYDSSGLFDIHSREGVGRSMITPIDDVAPGEYLVKITFTTNDIHKTKYRYVIVE